MTVKRRKRTEISAAALALIIFLAAAAYFIAGGRNASDLPPAEGEIKVYFIDVGQGDSALVCSDGGNVLVDAGPGSSADVLTAFVKSRVSEIDYMILTHPHEDHIGGADDILECVSVKNVIMPDASSESKTFSRLLDAIEKSGANVIEAKSGDMYDVGKMRLTLLAPNSDTYSETNDYSAVTKLEFGSFSVMFTGDAEELAEGEILSAYTPSFLKSTVLKAGHHGSSTSTSEAFLNAVMPEAAVISCGRDNDYGHPHSETLAKLNAAGVSVYRTDEDGTVTVTSDGDTYTVQRANG